MFTRHQPKEIAWTHARHVFVPAPDSSRTMFAGMQSPRGDVVCLRLKCGGALRDMADKRAAELGGFVFELNTMEGFPEDSQAYDALLRAEESCGHAEFDRFDICEAYAAIEAHYHVGGWLRERKSNQRRNEATAVQLNRMRFRAAPSNLDCFDALSENGKAIYRNLEIRYGFNGSN